jgi:endoglucanase
MAHFLRGAKRISKYLAAVMLLGSVAGCGASSVETKTEEPEAVQQAPVAATNVNTDYESPVQIPGTLVDQVGFNTGSDKIVIFKGENLPKSFSIKDLETGEVVYTGDIPEVSEGMTYTLSRFTDFKTRGKYCIYTDTLGESYSFSIDDDVYGGVFNTACRKYYLNRCGSSLSEGFAGDSARSACHTSMAHLQEDPAKELDVTGGWHMDAQADRDTALGSRIAEQLLIAYELNEKVFCDECGIPESGNGVPDILDEIRYEVDWLLKMQDSTSGGEYGAALTVMGQDSDVFTAPVVVTPVSMESTIAFASMMARFSYFYQKFDSEYATTCLRAADRAFNCYLNNQTALNTPEAFKAAAQLYRATGGETYAKVLEDCFSTKGFLDNFGEDENVFLGAVTYISTSQPVDMDRCSVIMKALMKRAEAIAKTSQEEVFRVSDPENEGNFEKILDDMRCLSITNHIIYNHEYTTIIENHAHYMLGMNPEAINFLSEDTERTYLDADKSGVMNDPGENALLILMLSAITGK